MEKAFDNVKCNKLFKILRKICLKYKDSKLIFILCRNQVSLIRVDDQEGNVWLRKGVRQGASFTPLNFNTFIEEAVKEIKHVWELNKTSWRENISVRFSYILLAGSEEVNVGLNGVEKLLREEFKLEISKSSSCFLKKNMKISRNGNNDS